jgi:hypothetical protein
MSLSVVPASFQTPIIRPKRVDWTPDGLAAHTESMRMYDLAVARRFAYATRGRYAYDDDDDVVVDVGGTGEAFVYPQLELSEVVRDLENEMEEEDEDEDDEEEENDDGMQWVDSPLKPLTYKLQSLSEDDLHQTMDDACCFCLEEFTRANCVTTSCKHSFCVTCYEKYQKKSSCPCCRQRVVSLTFARFPVSIWNPENDVNRFLRI